MKLKFFHLPALILMGTGSALAQTETPEQIHLTFDVDDAARVVISLNGEELNALQSGINEVDVDPWCNLNIAAADGCALVSVTDSEGEALTLTDNSVSIFLSNEVTEQTYTIVTAIDALNFTMNVDDPEAVSVCDRNYQRIELSEGENKLSMSSSKFPLSIGAATYGKALYKVTLDGVEIADNYGYSVTPTEGSVIDIISEFPDKECSVNFTVPDNTKDFFTAVCVNKEETTDFKKGITVKCGDSVQLYYNQYCWLTADEGTPVALAINGVEPSWFGPGYSFIVRDNTEVEVLSAVAAPMIPVVIDIDNPRNVIVYRCNEMFRDVIPLNEGTNTVKLPEEHANIVIKAVDGEAEGVECRIEGITINGRPKNVDYYNYMEIEDLDADDMITIFTSGFSTSGVADNHIDTVGISGNVYSITGYKVMENATEEKLSTLPAGIYIVNGQKICIK